MGFRFKWWDMVIYVYAHHSITRFRSVNRDFLKDLKHKRFRVRVKVPAGEACELDYSPTSSYPQSP